MKTKPTKVNKFESIEDSLDRIACSLATISGTLDNIFVEVMKDSERENQKMLEDPTSSPEFLVENKTVSK